MPCATRIENNQDSSRGMINLSTLDVCVSFMCGHRDKLLFREDLLCALLIIPVDVSDQQKGESNLFSHGLRVKKTSPATWSRSQSTGNFNTQ